MKYQIHQFLIILIFPVIFYSCKSEYDELADTLIGIDIQKQPNTLNKLLMLEGSYFDNTPFPRKTGMTPLGATAITGYPDTVSVSVGEPITIQFGLNNPIPQAFAQLRAVYLKVAGANGYWKARWDTANTTANRITLNFRIPYGLVRPQSLKLNYAVDIRATRPIPSLTDTVFITDTVSTVIHLIPPANCGDTLFRLPGYRLSIRKWNLGNKKGRVTVSFLSTYSNTDSPDRFDIKYNNRYVLSSAPRLLPPNQIPKCKGTGSSSEDGFIFTNGWKDYYFDYDPAISTEVIFYGLGNCYSPAGGYSVSLSCPK